MENVEEKCLNQEKEKLNKIKSVYIFIRHFTPVYHKKFADKMNEYGWPPENKGNYPHAKFSEESNIQNSIDPTDKQLQGWAKLDNKQRPVRSVNVPYDRKFDNVSRIESEGSILENKQDVKKHFEKIIQLVNNINNTTNKKANIGLLVGPRKRHGISGKILEDILQDEGIFIDENNKKAWHKLNDFDLAWQDMYELSHELDLRGPWDIKESNNQQGDKFIGLIEDRGIRKIESREDILKRTENVLYSLSQFIVRAKKYNKLKQNETPIIINETSDIIIKNIFDICQIENQPEVKPGDYLQIREYEDGSADLIFKTTEDDKVIEKKIKTLANYSSVIESLQKK
jgi:hypothetical protein